MPTTATASSILSDDWQNRSNKALRILAFAEIALILSTWPLWWGNHSFPVIPFIAGLKLPLIADRVVVCVLLMTCVFISGNTVHQPWHKIIRIVGVASALVLCVTNQHRLQAWHWLFVLGLGTSFFPENHLRLFRWVLASIYVCSALSRMAPSPGQGTSAIIIDQLLRMSGITLATATGGTVDILCHLINIGEFITGIWLIWPGSRRYGILAALTIHMTLLLALGPLGLRHHNAVLIWNLCFLWLIPVVFSGPDVAPHSTCGNYITCSQAATLLIWLFPLSGLVGIADNWPAWQLYSTRPESWTLRIRTTDAEHLHDRIRLHVSEPAPLDEWVTVRLDRWSLAETRSPLYPEDRFQCEVIRQVLATLPDDSEFRVEISEPARWLWWNRVYRTLTTRADLNAEYVR